MKRFFLLLVISLAIKVTPILANGSSVPNASIIETFNKEFKGAEGVRWQQVGDFQMALFTYHEHDIAAYFLADGELIGCSRDLLFNELPAAVTKSFEKRFEGAFYEMIHEISNEEGTSYWITLEAGNKRYHVKSDANGTFLKLENIKRQPGTLPQGGRTGSTTSSLCDNY